MAYWTRLYVKRAASAALTITTILLALSINTAFALSDEANLDRYLLAAKKYVNENNYEAAEKYLNKAKAIKTTLPAEYYYLSGKLLFTQKEYPLAREAFEAYINSTGKVGPFYLNSLELITEIEEIMDSKITSKQALSQKHQMIKRADGTALDSTNQRSNKLDRLKNQYASDNHQDGLIQHINSILKKNTYTGQAITKKQTKNLSYKIALTQNNEIILTKQDQLQTPTKITSETTSIYGKNALIEYQCDSKRLACVIQKPDGYDEWIKIRFSESSAESLAESLTLLIKQLQK